MDRFQNNMWKHLKRTSKYKIINSVSLKHKYRFKFFLCCLSVIRTLDEQCDPIFCKVKILKVDNFTLEVRLRCSFLRDWDLQNRTGIIAKLGFRHPNGTVTILYQWLMTPLNKSRKNTRSRKTKEKKNLKTDIRTISYKLFKFTLQKQKKKSN